MYNLWTPPLQKSFKFTSYDNNIYEIVNNGNNKFDLFIRGNGERQLYRNTSETKLFNDISTYLLNDDEIDTRNNIKNFLGITTGGKSYRKKSYRKKSYRKKTHRKKSHRKKKYYRK